MIRFNPNPKRIFPPDVIEDTKILTREKTLFEKHRDKRLQELSKRKRENPKRANRW